MPPKTRLWLLELRAPFFTATIVPILLGTLIAWARTGILHWGYFFLALLGGLLLHAGTNVANDYFDHLSRCDDINVEFVSPFTGGSRMIQEALLKPKEILAEALLSFALACLIGLYLIYQRGPTILVLGLVGLASGFFYTAPPISLASRGVGEFFVGLNFGVLMTVGSYYVQTQRLDSEPVVASIPVALLITAILYINEFQDAPADHAAGKDTLVVRLGRKRAALGYTILLAATYASICLGVFLRILSPFALLGLLTLPLAWKAIKIARLHYDDSLKLAPANANTILIHLSTGLLLSLGYLLERFV